MGFSMAVYFKNNTSGEFFMDCLGFDFRAKSGELYRIDEEFDYEDELLNNSGLIDLVKREDITIVINNRELTVIEGIDYLTQKSYLKDSENERWLYPEDSVNQVERFTQLRIVGRPLIVEAAGLLELAEGADIIIEN